jgi:YVTN family beta-propeller protein
VINTASNTVSTTVTVETDPEGVAITPNGLFAYVTNFGSGTVSVINTASNTVSTTVTVEADPEGVAITPNGLFAYVTNEGSGTVSVINTASNTVSTTVTVGTEPVAVAITPNGLFAYVANYISNTVSVIGTASNTVSTTVPEGNGSGPYAVAITTPALANDTAFQISYAANLNIGESYIDITNTGANGASLLGPGFGATEGDICANVYAFDPSEELIACCSCLLTPDQTVNLGVNRDLTVKTLTGVPETSVTIKLLGSLNMPNVAGAPTTSVTGCTNSAATVGTTLAGGGTNAVIVAGMAAWGTTLHAIPTAGSSATTEKPFTPSTLSAEELASITGRCASIIGNASGYGICGSCRAGALGASKLSQ